MKVAYLVSQYPVLSQTFVIGEVNDHLDAGLDLEVIALRAADKAAPGGLGRAEGRTRVIEPAGRLARVAALPGLLADPVARSILMDRAFQTWPHRFRAASLARFLRRRRYDVVHCHFGWTGRTAAYLKARGVLDARIVTTFHGADISQYVKREGQGAYSQLFQVGDLFLPVSQMWADELAALGCPRDKVKVHRMGVDAAGGRPAERSATPDALHVVTTGRMVEKKGQDDFLQALGALKARRPDLPVVATIVGGGPFRRELEQRAASLGLGVPRLRFAGALDHQEALKILAAADIFVLASKTAADGDQEGVPVSLMEAMALGLPVVSTRHSGIPELVEHAISGLLAPEGDWSELARLIERLADDDGLRRSLGSAGREKVRTDFNRQRLGQALRHHYGELVDRPAPRPLLQSA